MGGSYRHGSPIHTALGPVDHPSRLTRHLSALSSARSPSVLLYGKHLAGEGDAVYSVSSGARLSFMNPAGIV